ncbi:sensor histidine kinase [Nocardia transvalensis]|nr:sensor histidine kinase [Nocardia transvalensis]
MVVAIVMVLALLGVVIADEANAYRHTGDTAGAVSLALSVQDLVHDLQRERGLTNGLLGGDTGLRQAVGKQRAATDLVLLAVQNALSDNGSGAGPVRTALTQLASLSRIRADVDARHIDRAAVFQFYSNAVGALNQTRPGLDHAQDDEVWRGLQALYALGDAKEFTAQERGFLSGVFAAAGFGPGEYAQFLTIRAAKQAAVSAFQRDATAHQRGLLDAALRSEDATRAADAEAVAIDSERGALTRPVPVGDWWTQMTTVIDAQRDVQRAVAADIRSRADELRDGAATTLGAYLAVAVLAVLVLVALMVTSVRAIVRPLAALATEADEVATHRLPQLVTAWHEAADTEPGPPEPFRTPDGASDEIVSVAQAFDRVQRTAYELATEQALLRRNTTESLANLGRRNQNLVRRQLALISEFEREELDPKALGNMFELDHLATRMRRNAESLLVLVGEASPRRWSEPIPLTDVIRAALSEVDDYRRVVLRRVDDVPIAGGVVSELAHMLAELIENGLAYSPPDLEVEIYGRRIGQPYMLAVVDHGVGMPPDQLAAANARLRGEADFLVAPTRFLGHYVVGRLAERLGIEVELTVSPVSGVVARMLLPPELMADLSELRSDWKKQPPQQLWTPPAALAAPPAETTALLRPVEPSAAPPDPFPTLPPGPMKDSLKASAAQRLSTSDTGTFPADAETPDTESDSNNIPGREDSGRGSHYTDPAPVTEVQRTRNGLVKRTRKTGKANTAAARPTTVSTQPVPPVAERSPEEVRGMLANFRAGHSRGEQAERHRVPASPTQEEIR